MNLHTLIFTGNACYKAGVKIAPKGIMVHSTGANNPWLKRYVGPDDGKLGENQYNNHWNQSMSRNVCAHAFIGKLADGTIATYKTLPWDHRGWHCYHGKNGSGNDTHISFEICEDGLNDAIYFNKVYREAAELCAYLCKMYHIDVKNIICHSEGYDMGIASNHGDVMHWFPRHGKNMDTFRAYVSKLLEDTSVVEPPTTEEETNDVEISLKFKTGDIVNFCGSKHYSSTNSASGSTAKTGRVKITSICKTGKHPYHCRSVSDAGAYIGGVYGWVNEVDLSAIVVEVPETKPVTPEMLVSIKKGDVVSIAKNATYYAGNDIPDWVIAKNWIVAETPVDDRVVINKSTDGKYAINSPISAKFLTVVKADKPWTPKVGDIVNYNGSKHYANANSVNGSSCSGGQAKITNIYQLGKSKHPYHLVRISGKGASVYGWVDEGSFTKA